MSVNDCTELRTASCTCSSSSKSFCAMSRRLSSFCSSAPRFLRAAALFICSFSLTCLCGLLLSIGLRLLVFTVYYDLYLLTSAYTDTTTFTTTCHGFSMHMFTSTNLHASRLTILLPVHFYIYLYLCVYL